MHVLLDRMGICDYNVTMLTNAMKLRKIGNSLGTTFSREVLQKAGFEGDEDLEVSVTTGEIRLHRANSPLMVELTRAEANALADGKLESKAAVAVFAKVRKLVAANT